MRGPIRVEHTRTLKHVTDVRSAGRVGEDRRLQVFGREPVADRQGEHIDDLVGVRTDEVGTEDSLARVLDEDLEAVRWLGHPAPRIHLRCCLALTAELKTAL